MGFFDLNIPYEPSSKSSSLKLVIKAMELGYSGVAFNRTIKTTLSDLDRCSIALYSVPRLLALDPSLASSVSFHRKLLSVPQSSTFRQHTRLTLAFDGTSQASLLTGGNAILKSYDIVAVQPLTQTAFDYACQTAEVDIISVDFAEKLPFQLKMPMVEAAINRGVYFEIRYSSLVTDVQARREVLHSAKLLVDWSQGQNLIITSAAPSVNEFRGPYDVAVLLSLLGLSMEQAKASISKNCRNLVTSALRKKYFDKETIRIRPISTDKISDMKKSLVLDSSKWDPISSGEGDLQLDDLAQSFVVATKASKTVKTTDLAVVTGGCQSSSNLFLAGTKPNEASFVNFGVSEKRGCHNLLVGISQKAAVDIDANSVCVADDKLDILSENQKFQTSVIDAESNTVSTAAKNCGEAAMQEEEHGDAAFECTLHVGNAHIPVLATSDDKTGSITNCEILSEGALKEHDQDLDTEKVFVLENDPTVAKNPSVASCLKVKEEQEHRDIGTETILVLDDYSNFKDNTPVQSVKARRKRKKNRQPHLSPSKPLEEHMHGDLDTSSIAILDGDLDVKGKAKAKHKRYKKSSSPFEHFEEQQHGHIDADSIPGPDSDSNMKDNHSITSSKERQKQNIKDIKKVYHLPSVWKSKQYGEIDAESILDPNGKAKAKCKRHKKILSPSKHLEE